MSDSEDSVNLPDEGGDLFGDDDDQIQSDQDGALSDHELESNQDYGERRARHDDDNDDAEDQEVQMKRIMGITVHRHRTPKTKDGFLQSMKVPYFLKFQAEEYNPDTFEPTEWDTQNVRSDKRKNVVRFQRDPETGELKSNAVVYKWSDGSLTMSVGGDHYEIQKKGMAPSADKPYYEERDDAHYYVAAAHFTSELFLTVGHVSEQYTVNLSSTLQDEATLKFSRDMAAVARARNSGAGMFITTTKNPELQKREAELADKEQMKALRRRETMAARADTRTVAYKAGGLSIGDLEGGRRAGGPRKRGAPGSSKGKRRRAEYDSDDDFPSGSRRQNEYDREDDFIAPSDEEGMSEGEDEDDEEDILDDDEDEEEAPRKKRHKTADAEDDADADADLDDVEAPAPAAESSRGRRRHIVDEDDEEE